MSIVHLSWAAAVAQEVLGVVLLWAALSKLRTFAAFVQGLAGEVPRRGASLLAIAIVAVELLLGGMLLFQILARVASGAAFVLLTLFTAFLLVHLRNRTGIPCNCFGATSDRPIAVSDIARNVGLLALALFGIAEQGNGQPFIISTAMSVAEDFARHPATIVILAVVVGQSYLIAAKLRPAHVSKESPAPRQAAQVGYTPPDLTLNAGGEAVNLLALLARNDESLMVVLGAKCADCARLVRSLQAEIRNAPGRALCHCWWTAAKRVERQPIERVRVRGHHDGVNAWYRADSLVGSV